MVYFLVTIKLHLNFFLSFLSFRLELVTGHIVIKKNQQSIIPHY